MNRDAPTTSLQAAAIDAATPFLTTRAFNASLYIVRLAPKGVHPRSMQDIMTEC